MEDTQSPTRWMAGATAGSGEPELKAPLESVLTSVLHAVKQTNEFCCQDFSGITLDVCHPKDFWALVE